jgi:hypothetical protein
LAAAEKIQQLISQQNLMFLMLMNFQSNHWWIKVHKSAVYPLAMFWIKPEQTRWWMFDWQMVQKGNKSFITSSHKQMKRYGTWKLPPYLSTSETKFVCHKIFTIKNKWINKINWELGGSRH